MATEDDPLPEWAQVPATTLDQVPDLPADDDPTGPTDMSTVPGYEFGYAAGEGVGLERGINRVLAAFRLSQIDSGTDAGVAFKLAELLLRWMEANKERLDDRTPA